MVRAIRPNFGFNKLKAPYGLLDKKKVTFPYEYVVYMMSAKSLELTQNLFFGIYSLVHYQINCL